MVDTIRRVTAGQIYGALRGSFAQNVPFSPTRALSISLKRAVYGYVLVGINPVFEKRRRLMLERTGP